MKNKLSISHLTLIITLLFFGCRGPVKEDKNNASENSVSSSVKNGKQFEIDIKESIVEWKGSNSIGTNTHTGYVHISKGELIIENDQLMGGTAEIDMNTIEDENHQSNSGLINHLKDPDFFDAEKFPFSTIAITKAESITMENKQITGNLTIKGITHPVTFLAKMEIKNGIVKIDGNLVIDRTKWGVRYKSGKFYDNLADGAISDSIEFHINIVAKNKC